MVISRNIFSLENFNLNKYVCVRHMTFFYESLPRLALAFLVSM